jgi:D-lactate dehydrogenase
VNVAIFSAKKYDREFLNAANGSVHKLRFFEPHLNEETAGLATGFESVCVFVNDHVDAAVIAKLRSLGVRHFQMRPVGLSACGTST